MNETPVSPEREDFARIAAGFLGDPPPTTWPEVKARLEDAFRNERYRHSRVVSGIADWLSTWDRGFGAIAADFVCTAGSALSITSDTGELRFRYDPHSFEALLMSASGLLDRSLSYRREMAEFETSGVKVALDYLAFVYLRPTVDAIDQCGLQDVRATKLAASQTSAAEKFLNGGAGNPVALGMAQQATGSAGDYQDLAASETERRTLLSEKSQLLQQAQDAMFSRYLAIGSASNFAERYLRMTTLLAEDIAEAYQKLFAASCGINTVLGISFIDGVDMYLPRFDKKSVDDGTLDIWLTRIVPSASNQRRPDVLDGLVIWTRAVMREIERVSQFETEDIFSLPLNQWNWGDSSHKILKTDDIESSSRTGRILLNFVLQRSDLPFFSVCDRARITGLGLSITGVLADGIPLQYCKDFDTYPPPSDANQDQKQKEDNQSQAINESLIRRAKFNAFVTPPDFQFDKRFSPDGQADSYSRVPAYLGDVRIEGGDSGFVTANLCTDSVSRNITIDLTLNQPTGDWQIDVNTYTAIWAPLDYTRISNPGQPNLPPNEPLRLEVTGLILYLRIRYRPKGAQPHRVRELSE
jgi:hypothetical protein